MTTRSKKAAASPATPTDTAEARRLQTGAAFGLMLLGTGTVLHFGLLPFVFAACVGILLTRLLNRRMPHGMSASVVIALPLMAAVLGVFHAKGLALGAIDQYRALLEHLAKNVTELRARLPAEIGHQLPSQVDVLQAWLAGYLKTQAGTLAELSKSWLHGVLLAYVGIIVGALAARPAARSAAHFATVLRSRLTKVLEAFREIVAAQLWIAGFNACWTALFLFVVLPLFGVTMPYAASLVLLTFIAGLVPIVGNLLCNAVVTLVGVSVSLPVAAACLGFLILVHKAEYVINAKVIGSRTQTSTWELLTVMFVCESIFGVPGLVAAPLFYAYVKKELQAAGWV